MAINPGIPALKILMNATHTHTGPTTYGENADWRAGPAAVSSCEVPPAGILIASADTYREFFDPRRERARRHVRQHERPDVQPLRSRRRSFHQPALHVQCARKTYGRGRERALPLAELGVGTPSFRLLLAEGSRSHPCETRQHLHPAARRCRSRTWSRRSISASAPSRTQSMRMRRPNWRN
jgi:hypothetical protein